MKAPWEPDLFTLIKVYVVELAATTVFVVFVGVEAWKTIEGLLGR